MTTINGGAVVWARQTIDSDIFCNKPDKWFKIWFYLVMKVNHTDNKRFKKAEGFIQQKVICEVTGATPDQVKKCFFWLREMGMISTKRSTRGTVIKVLKYEGYQNLDNYYSTNGSTLKARKKHEGSTTINKNDKNDKNVINNIYTHWNSKEIVVHKNNLYKSNIMTALNKYSEDEIITAITNYKTILSGEQYFFNYKWVLKDFLNRGIDKFLDLEIAKNNYTDRKNNKKEKEDNMPLLK